MQMCKTNPPTKKKQIEIFSKRNKQYLYTQIDLT